MSLAPTQTFIFRKIRVECEFDTLIYKGLYLGKYKWRINLPP